MTVYKTAKINEIGPKNAPTILLLHGLPTSSHMFRNLMQYLSDEFHMIAPDYPESGAHPYKKDLKDVETYILNTGHFALEEDGDVIAQKISQFVKARPEIRESKIC